MTDGQRHFNETGFPERRTIIVNGRLAMRELRLEAARNRSHGVQIMTWDQMAARLAGGFTSSIDADTLRALIQEVLPVTPLGELDSIKMLPGMVDAVADTLMKIWLAGILLDDPKCSHPRLASLAALKTAVLARLPPAMLPPDQLLISALKRSEYGRKIFGKIEIRGITELAPIWRPLLLSLAREADVTWNAGPRSVPVWLESPQLKIDRSAPQNPAISVVTASTPYHEAIEAMRWARQLLASGTAKPEEIAFASTATADYDAHFLSLRRDADFDVRFVHGTSVLANRDGQTAAALADILIRGVSQTRLRRLADLSHAFDQFPDGWKRILRTDVPMTTADAWDRLLSTLTAANWPDGNDKTNALRYLVDILMRGTEAATEAGEVFLSRLALTIWRKALLAGPASRLDMTLETLKQDDSLDACVGIAWMPASELAAAPRRFARLLGLNSSRWPRGRSEDRLLSDHIIPTAELDPLPVYAADRRDFETIIATTETSVVLSRARRDSDGRLLGRSALLVGRPDAVFLRRNAIPTHAYSESDRLMARPTDFKDLPQALSAAGCWYDWHRPEITAHDGLIRPGHPAILAVLGRRHSASSLRTLLRNPIGFIWNYCLRWREPADAIEPLVLDALGFGSLVHSVLDSALRTLETDGSLASAGIGRIQNAISTAADEVAELWANEHAVPPAVIWRRTLHDAREMACSALTYNDQNIPDARAYGEVPFGGEEPKSNAGLPWDPAATIKIPGTEINIGGYIDRLDLAADKSQAMVRDYKTGKKPKDGIVLNGGSELQRCLYAFAVKAMLGDAITVSASLFYPNEGADMVLENPQEVLNAVCGYLKAARAKFLAGNSVIGPDAGNAFDKFMFALPANAKAGYCRLKTPAATTALGDAAKVWEAL